MVLLLLHLLLGPKGRILSPFPNTQHYLIITTQPQAWDDFDETLE